MALPDTYSVYRLTEQSSFRALKLFKEPFPRIAPHEVLVKVKAVALNYRDLAMTNGTYPAAIKKNLVPCSDGAGEVVAVGDSVSGLQKGDWVVGNFDLYHLYGPRLNRTYSQGGMIDGNLREYVVLPEISATKIPKTTHLSFPEMASLVCTGVTAWNALYGNIPLKPGQTVLFQGAFSRPVS